MWSFFEGLVDPFKSEHIEQPPRSFFKFIAYYTKGMWPFLLVIGLASSLVAAGEALFFYYMGSFVDILNSSTPDTLWSDHKSTFITFGLLTVVFLPVLVLLHHLLLNQTLRSNYAMQIRYRMHRYLLRQSVSFFANDFAGRLSQKVMQTAMGVRESVVKFTNVIVHMIVYFCTMLGMLAEANGYLMLILLGWLLIYILIMWHFIPRLRQQSSNTSERVSVMIGRIVDSYANIQTVKLFSRDKHEENYARKSMGDCLHAEYHLMRIVTKFDLYVQLINYLLIAGLVFTACLLWCHSLVTVGAIAVSFGLAIRINNLSQWVMWEVGILFENIGNVQNGMETIAQPLSVTDSEKPITLQNVKGEIEFRHVRFAYTENNPVFQDLCLKIKPGERIGIVGYSGGGKSTLVSLLLRFYDVQGGAILLDGHDIREIKQEDLRKTMAMVTQDTSLLHRTVRENILYGQNQTANASELDTLMQEAAEQAKALDFINQLNDRKGNKGFETMVGERGVRLSGGQRQRIAIARVILKNSPILILDEATSALDSEVEAAIKDNLNHIMDGKTVIAIAHRLSTIAKMDRLIVLNHGTIAEQGTHQELLALNGIYATMWKRQTDGFIGDAEH